MRIGIMFTAAIALGMSLAQANAQVQPSAEISPQVQPSIGLATLYTQQGTDPSFQSLITSGKLPVGRTSTAGVTGSKILVNHSIIDKLPNAGNRIPTNIAIHTLANSYVGRTYFSRWTRWYQEDGNTQIFRLFKGEYNVRNDRPLSARIEAFSTLKWTKGVWHEWQGTYTIVKPHSCSIFQVKNTVNDWAVMMNLTSTGNIILNHRRGQADVTVLTGMTGKSFELKIRDNGLNYEVYINGKKVGAGSYERPEGTTSFRWGIYLGETELKTDALVFVTGAKFK